MLERFRTRAPTYRENRFFQEDFDDLKAAGYLKMTVPKGLGEWDSRCATSRR